MLGPSFISQRVPKRDGGIMTIEPEWQKAYKTAILETDWGKIEERIEGAESAIKGRLYEFSQDHGGTPEENTRLMDALRKLAILRRDVANWQESKDR